MHILFADILKSPTGIGQIANSFPWICIIYMYVLSNSSIPVDDLAITSWRFGQYWLAIWPIPVGDFVNTGWRFQNVGKKDMHNLYVCIVKFINTGWWFGQYQLAIWPIRSFDVWSTYIYMYIHIHAYLYVSSLKK